MNSTIKVINHEGFIRDLKAAHKGQGVLKLRGRNPNRKQFYPETNRITTYRDGTTWTRKSRYQQDLPVSLATYFAFYGNKTILTAIANVYKAAGINVFAIPTK